MLRRRLGSLERDDVVLMLCCLGVFFLTGFCFEDLGGACRCFWKCQIQNLWDKKGAEDQGDTPRASPRGRRELAAPAGSFHCSLKPPNPCFGVQNSVAIDTSFLNESWLRSPSRHYMEVVLPRFSWPEGWVFPAHGYNTEFSVVITAASAEPLPP